MPSTVPPAAPSHSRAGIAGMTADIGLGRSLKLSVFVLLDYRLHTAAHPDKDLNIGGLERCKGIGTTISGQYGLHTLCRKHLCSLNACAPACGNVGIGQYFELHCVRVYNHKLLAPPESWLDIRVQIVSLC